jgi:high-affinity Fe2+/Pb2+ permease
MSYLKEDNGKSSSMRTMFIGGMIWSMLIGSTVLFMGYKLNWEPNSIIAVFTAVFLSSSGVFTGAKLAQKPMEDKKKE